MLIPQRMLLHFQVVVEEESCLLRLVVFSLVLLKKRLENLEHIYSYDHNCYRLVINWASFALNCSG